MRCPSVEVEGRDEKVALAGDCLKLVSRWTWVASEEPIKIPPEAPKVWEPTTHYGTRRLDNLPTFPLEGIEVWVVNHPIHLLTGFPAECNVTLRTPHLITTADLEDRDSAPRARSGLFLHELRTILCDAR